jgi:hypothetical protein
MLNQQATGSAPSRQLRHRLVALNRFDDRLDPPDCIAGVGHTAPAPSPPERGGRGLLQQRRCTKAAVDISPLQHCSRYEAQCVLPQRVRPPPAPAAPPSFPHTHCVPPCAMASLREHLEPPRLRQALSAVSSPPCARLVPRGTAVSLHQQSQPTYAPPPRRHHQPHYSAVYPSPPGATKRGWKKRGHCGVPCVS